MNYLKILAILFTPILALAMVIFYYPNIPVKDELIFAHDITQFSRNGICYLLQMKSAHGPIFLYFLSLIGKWLSFATILPFRLINVVFAGAIAAISIKFIDQYKLPLWVVIPMVLNPYFWGLTSTLIYSDNSVILLLLLALIAYLNELNFVSIMCLSLAVLIRQTAVLGVISFLVLEAMFIKDNKWFKFFLYCIPLLALGLLIYFWGGSLMSPNVSKAYSFYKTVGGFNYQLLPMLKSILYQLSLIGFLSILFLDLSINRNKIISMILLIIICIIVEPIHINQRYHHLMLVLLDAGYLDRFLQIFTPISYIVIGWIINNLCWTIWEGRRNIFNDKLNAFIFIFMLCNIGFYSISTFWDKYYIIMGLLVPILLVRIKNDSFDKRDEAKNPLRKFAYLSKLYWKG
jgi:hypothetical protein